MDDVVRQFVSDPHIAVLSTVSPSGRPEGSAVWYIYEHDAFWFDVAASSLKVRNLRQNPHAALTIDTRAWPYREAVVNGRVEEVPMSRDRSLRLAIRYLGEETGSAVDAHMEANIPRVSFRLSPAHVHWHANEA